MDLIIAIFLVSLGVWVGLAASEMIKKERGEVTQLIGSLIFIVTFFVGIMSLGAIVWSPITANAQVTMTAQVPLTEANMWTTLALSDVDNCNFDEFRKSSTSSPVIESVVPNEFGYNFFMWWVGNAFVAIHHGAYMDFYIGSAHYRYTGGDKDVVYDECKS